MSKESNQRPTGMTGVKPATPKSIPGGPLKPASTGPLQKPTGLSSKKGQQGRGG